MRIGLISGCYTKRKEYNGKNKTAFVN